MSRQINQAGLDLIKEFEGLRLKVYKDQVGLNTVGWGHRTDLPVGHPITMSQARAWLSEDLEKFQKGVSDLVKIKLTDNQFSTLVSFTYNLGLTALRVSHLLTELNKGNLDKAAAEIPKWCHEGIKVIPGLVRRREAEKELFLKE